MGNNKNEYKKAKRRLYAGLSIPLVTGSLLTLLAANNMLEDSITNPFLSLSTRLSNSSQVNMSVYNSYIHEQSQHLYEELRLGNISTAEFARRYETLTSEETLETWARNSKDPAIQLIIAEYDQDLVEQDALAKDTITKFASGMGIIGTTAVASVFLEDHIRKKYSDHTTSNQDMQHKYTHPSAMSIEDPTTNTTVTELSDVTIIEDEEGIQMNFHK
jgi:hypothetical protein